MTQTVTVTYLLSDAGQRAALLAGRPASKTVTDQLPLDPEYLDQVKINLNGSVSYDASGYVVDSHNYHSIRTELDAPPASLASLIAAVKATRARAEQEYQEYQAAQTREKVEQEERAVAARVARRPQIEELLTLLEAMPDPLGDLPRVDEYRLRLGTWPEIQTRDGYQISLDADHIARLQAASRRRGDATQAKEAAEKAAEQAKHDAKIAAREAKIAEHGGHWWMPDGGMCSFLNYGLWNSGQSRRWVGVFLTAKGIDRFLESPRGEHVFDTRSLQRGDCLQGGGFDANSRGKRRNESEWFGVVIQNDTAGLLIQMHGSRSATLAAARKLS